MFFYRGERFSRRILKSIFNFDSWHISTLSDRKYAADIIIFLNNFAGEKRDRVVEVGCGLGDIIRNLHFQKKIGYDGEKNVIKAASFLSLVSFDRTSFFQFTFPSSPLRNSWNAIIMVNWIHHIEPTVLKKNIETYFLENLLQGGSIIVDTVQAINYKYNHNISYLTSGISCSLIKIGSYENQREIFAIVKS
jgi:hypothetical protein